MTRLRAIVAVVAVCACVLATAGTAAAGSDARPRVAWSQLRNPVIGYATRATKDPAIVFAHGRWRALFSSIGADGTWRVGITTSRDMRHWSALRFMPHDPRVGGEASPDVVRAPDGRWVVTFQSSPHDVAGGESKLYYRTTADFEHFSRARPLAHELHPAPGDRMIDAALVWSPAGLLVGYKVGGHDGPQAFELARSTTGSLDGPWVAVGRPGIRVYGDTIENYQFLRLGGRFALLATSNVLDQPFVFSLTGDPHAPSGWLHWSAGRMLDVPQEAWNPGHGLTGSTYEHANSAFLVDRRAVDGRYYLVYADSPELVTFAQQGHARLGLARSTDLVHWSVPESRAHGR